MPVKANFIMNHNSKDFKMLGGQYKNTFSVGDYVEWRRICRDENYEETIKIYYGLITNLRTVDVGGRLVWYADVLGNNGKEDLVLLSKIRKMETN